MGIVSDTEITGSAIQQALAAVLDSDLFARLERIRDFLTYIVKEEIAGRGDALLGKVIAKEVYGREPIEGGDPENIVRVEARRLRQLLDLYYETIGSRDPIRIYVDTGGYRPRFEKVEAKQEYPAPSKWRSLGIPLAIFTIGAVIGMVAILLVPEDREKTPTQSTAELNPRQILERQTILGKSPSALQAVNLAQQARAMIFPIFDRPRQLLMTEVFRRVIELDPDYFGGYAGAAQTMGMLAIMTPTGHLKEELLAGCDQMAQDAIRLAPTNSWVQSARAWAYIANGKYDEALLHSHRAAKLDPDDGNILDFHGSVALFTGNFAEAVASAEKARNKGGSNQRFANRNIFAAASFHLGNFEQSLKAFQAAAEYGDPISAPSYAFQAADLNSLGRTEEALRKISELKTAWPKADLNTMLRSIYQHPEHAAQVLDHLIELGWSIK